ncbi:recQ-like DNA helicase Blm [Anopheles nili]|uniref:recQ-like DNA helicase Blm n=1 Tax=Anopheles nili TaxID=185578 RepID=UPI00237B5F33|nr:recQ-like DNA helicase Blm [Anopheles nili]
MSKKLGPPSSRSEPMKQTSLSSFIRKKDKPQVEQSLRFHTEAELQITSTTPSESTKVLSSPSIFKPKLPVSKRTATVINLLCSDSDENSRSPIKASSDKPDDRKRLPARDIFKECIVEGNTPVNGYDEYDLMVVNTKPLPKPINNDPIELNLLTNERYMQAQKKLEENMHKLAKISPEKTPKFEFKLPQANRMSLALDKSSVFSNDPEDDDDFERKKPINFTSTPVAAGDVAKRNGIHEKKDKVDTPSELARLLTPGKGTAHFQFDKSLETYLDEVSGSAWFNSKSPHEREVRKNVQFLQEAQLTLLNHFYDLFAKVPSKTFLRIDKSFDVACFDRLKSTIESIRGKTEVYDRALAKMSNPKLSNVSTNVHNDSSLQSQKKSSATVSTAPIVYDVPFNDSSLLEENEPIEQAFPLESSRDDSLVSTRCKFDEFEKEFGLRKIQETSTKAAPACAPLLKPLEIAKSSGSGATFVFKKPIASTLLNRADTPPQIANQPKAVNRQRDSFSSFIDKDLIDPDDQVDEDDILNSIREAELIDQGRHSNLSTVDLTTPNTSMRRSDPPRITFPVEPMPPVSHRNTQFIEDIHTQLDDDGWQVYDPTMYDGVEMVPAPSIATQPGSGVSSSSIQVTGGDIGRFHEGIRNDGITGEFDGMSYPHSVRLQLAFKETFGLRTFRPNQLQVINATLLGKDCFVLMPTGGGKSLCYQLPAVLTVGLTVVVSPLKSLILDQVQKLNSLDIPAGHMSGDISVADVQRIYDDLYSSCPELKLLYVTPEKISSSAKFQNLLSALYRRGQLGRIVIDEAHCVSAWGHDFRPDYKKLSALREQFPTVPIIALTATANPRVRLDILAQLKLARDTRWFLSSFNRPNLKYLVLPKKGTSTKAEMIELIRKRFPRDTGIVYCLSKKECDQLATEFRRAGIKAKSYHAGLTDSVREETQKEWIGDRIKVVCATIAFGMGIDKPDVRYVLHYCMPKSIEGYYQESGRAGRDGEIATCILYYNYSDMLRYRKMMDSDTNISMEAKQIHMNNLFRMVNYCENVTDCRRTQQLEYFAEYFTSEQCLSNRATACDNCLTQSNYRSIDVTDDCVMIAKAVRDLCGGRNRFTLLHLVEVLKGSEMKKVLENGHNRTVYHGKLKAWERCDIQRLLRKLVIEEYLKEDLIFSNDIPQAYLRIGSKIESLVGRRVRIEFSIKEKQQSRGKVTKQDVTAAQESTIGTQISAELRELQTRCYNDLLEICRAIAMQKNATLASIMNIQALKTMSEKLPESPAEMLALPHVTKANFEKYGKQLLEITQNYAAEKLCFLMDTQDQDEAKAAAELSGEDDSDGSADGTDWNALARAASHGAGGSGYKRKRSWGTGSGKTKVFRRGTGQRKAATGRKRTSTGTKRGGATKRGGSSRGRGTARVSYNLLPMPGEY